MADSLPDHDSILSRETTPGRPSYPNPLTPEPDVNIDDEEYFSCDGGRDGDNDGPDGDNDGPDGDTDGPDGDNDGPDGDNDGPDGDKDPPGREETPPDSMYFSDSEDVSSASDDDVSQHTAYFEHN